MQLNKNSWHAEHVNDQREKKKRWPSQDGFGRHGLRSECTKIAHRRSLAIFATDWDSGIAGNSAVGIKFVPFNRRENRRSLAIFFAEEIARFWIARFWCTQVEMAGGLVTGTKPNGYWTVKISNRKNMPFWYPIRFDTPLGAAKETLKRVPKQTGTKTSSFQSWKKLAMFRSLRNDKFAALSKSYCRGVSHEKKKQRFGRSSSLPPMPPPSQNRKFYFYCRPTVSEFDTPFVLIPLWVCWW